MTINHKLTTDKLNRLDIEEYRNIDKARIIIILDNIRSAINVGSIFRTSDALRIEKIYLCGITAIPPNKELLKSALGATESVIWESVETTLEIVKKIKKESKFKIISVEQTQKSTFLNDFVPEIDEKYAFIFGNEIDGVDQEIINVSDKCIEIPQFGTKHSLNVAVTAGIVLWDVFSKMQLQKTKCSES